MVVQDAERLDLSVGQVPPYPAFVRHVWAFWDPEGFSVSAPPVVYRAIFEKADYRRVRALVSEMQEGFGDRIGWHDLSDGARELRFSDLEALHMFCCLVGMKARVNDDESTALIGEFIMWTLGFRWV